jgi:hypothetical protein
MQASGRIGITGLFELLLFLDVPWSAIFLGVAWGNSNFDFMIPCTVIGTLSWQLTAELLYRSCRKRDRKHIGLKS